MPNSVITKTPSNSYWDFAETPDGQDASYAFGALGDFLAGMKYYVLQDGDATFPTERLIDLAGNYITSGYTWTRTTPAYNNIYAFRKVTAPGRQQDKVILYDNAYLGQSGIAAYVVKSNTIYDYVWLQLSVPVTKYTTLSGGGADLVTTVLQPNSTTNIAINTEFKLDKSENRGDEVDSQWEIYKIDPTGVNPKVFAVLNVDYTLTLGNLTSDVIKLKFLTNNNFEIRNSAVGYRLSQNPYKVIRNDTSFNRASSVYNFVLTANNFDTVIQFPKLDVSASVQSTLLINPDPFTTYQNANIAISHVLNTTNAYWKKLTLANSPVFVKLEFVATDLIFSWLNSSAYTSVIIETSPDQITWTPNTVSPVSPYNSGSLYTTALTGVNYFRIKAQTATFTTEVSNVFSIDLTAMGNASPIATAPSPSVTVLSVTDNDWLAEISNKCNIKLEVRNKSTDELIITKYGLGPHNISLINPINYNAAFVLTLK